MVQHFIKNWRTPKEDIRKALRIAKYNAGVLYPIISNTSQDLSYVKDRTILATKKHLEAPPHPDLLREERGVRGEERGVMDKERGVMDKGRGMRGRGE